MGVIYSWNIGIIYIIIIVSESYFSLRRKFIKVIGMSGKKKRLYRELKFEDMNNFCIIG